MQCPEVSKFVYVYLDGEFEPRERAEFEQHVSRCPECGEMLRFERSFHQLVRERIERPEAPEGLRDRVLAALDEEDAADSGLWARVSALSPAWKWAPVAAAAALIAVLAVPGLVRTPDTNEAAPAVASAPLESLVEETVAVHEEALPTEVSGDEESVGRFVAGRVSFRATPPFQESETTRLIGARLTRVGSRPAVLYTYEHEGKRVSVVQYAEPSKSEAKTPFRRAFYTGRAKGHNVAFFRDRDRGVANSVVGDVDEGSLVRLIPASYKR